MTLSLVDFWRIGREQRFGSRHPAVRTFITLFGPPSLHPHIRSGHVLRTVKELDLPADAHILDAGSGRGLVLFQLAQRHPSYRLEGIEIDPAMVADGERMAANLKLQNLRFVQGDLNELADLGGPFDLIVSVDVLEHVADDAALLKKMRRAIAPGGKLLLHLPLRHQQQRRIFSVFEEHTVDDHVRDEYLPDEINPKLHQAGFQVRQLNYGFSWMGELAFELNTLFWERPALRGAIALLTYPIAWWLAFLDTRSAYDWGNSMVIVAEAQSGT